MSMFTRLAGALLISALPIAGLAEGEETEAPPANLPAISVVAAETSRLTDRVIASGLIGAVETIFVQPQIEGQAIDEIMVDVGDDVVQGQLLARLSDTALQLQKSQLEASMASVQAQIAQAVAQITDAETARNEAMKQWDRTEKLLVNGNVSEAAADQVKAAATSADVRLTVARQGLLSAQAQLKVVEAQMADVDLRLLRTNVIAPVAGKLTAKNAMVGAIASGAGQPLFVIAREGRLELIADIAEIDILKLSPGEKAVMSVVGMAETITGTVRLVEPTLNTATRLGKVRIALDDSLAVREGMFAEADITVDERDALVIPVSAVGGSADAPTVFKVTDGKVIQTAVKTGIRDGGLIEIVEGLAKCDLVVAKAGAFVRDGDRVNPVVIENELLAGH
jgi:HlyD family secretion protein